MFAAIVGQSWADDAHPFNFEINGNDHVGRLQWPRLRIEMAGPGTNGSLYAELEDPTAAIDIAEWDEVRLIEHAATPRPILFGGFVQSVRYRAWAAGGRTILLQCVGYGVLLDKKVVPTYAWGDQISPVPHILALVNRHGGRVTATSWDNVGTDAFNPNDEEHGVPMSTLSDWLAVNSLTSTTDPDLQAPTRLRAGIEYLSGLACSLDLTDPLFERTVAEPFVYWVDSAAMFRCLPDLHPDSVNYNSGGAGTGHFRQQWDGSYPGVVVDTSGTQIIDGDLEYEREDSDRLTSVYVAGANAAGSGYVRSPGLERAGDLEDVLSESSSDSAATRDTRGSPAITKTSSGTATGSVPIASTTPLAVWPGRHLIVTAPAAELSGAEEWRITGVRIAFRSSTYRVYTLAFGGSVPQPSAMRRIGKFAPRSR